MARVGLSLNVHKYLNRPFNVSISLELYQLYAARFPGKSGEQCVVRLACMLN